MELGQALQQAPALGCVATQRRDGSQIPIMAIGLSDGLQQDRVRVDLDDGVEARVEQPLDGVGEEHGLDNFLRILARGRPVRLTVHFLPVLTGAQLENRKTIALAAREALLRELAACR